MHTMQNPDPDSDIRPFEAAFFLPVLLSSHKVVIIEDEEVFL